LRKRKNRGTGARQASSAPPKQPDDIEVVKVPGSWELPVVVRELANRSGIQAKHAGRLRLILGRLNASTGPRDMNLPGLALHELRGSRKGTWAVKGSGNWRVTFSCAGKDVDRVDYEDYH
jgi:proteic killer suppression protein